MRRFFNHSIIFVKLQQYSKICMLSGGIAAGAAAGVPAGIEVQHP